MSKILRAVLISAYSALIFHFIKSILTDQHEEYLEINYVLRTPGTLRKIHRDIKKNRKNITALTTHFKRPKRLATDLKYILKWTEAFSHYNSPIFTNGQRVFLENNCTYSNCYMTNDKSLLVDPRYFDAILFDVENNWDSHPPLRTPYQKFIFTASESADNYPICNPYFDSYYNLTWSYKLDSDVRWSYVTILDKKGNFVGPKINMTWTNRMEPTSDKVIDILRSKKKAVAWFVSNCRSKSGRENVARDLSKALVKYKLRLDIYGWCGNLTCPRDRIDVCLDLLRTDYYFYLAFENSISEDYVTEKILYPLQHYTVPVVYGGADYSRFLPPNSYINARTLSTDKVASLIAMAVKEPHVYYNYFRWHNYYTYKESPPEADVCVLCKVLNDPTKNSSVVTNFRQWWNPKYKELCKEESNKNVVEVFYFEFNFMFYSGRPRRRPRGLWY